MKYDVAIIGAGLGGLQCAYILSKEGYNVCLLEKNHQIGGCLQTFKRNGSVFDTGMHYIGSMDQGQILNKYFQYFNLNKKLKLKRLDEDAYDIIRFGGEEFKFAMGYDRFVETMLEKFPSEKEALTKYVNKQKEISHSVDLYSMRDFSGPDFGYYKYFGAGFNDFLCSITTNEKLKSVLAGTVSLYAGVQSKTPVYIPLIIHNSFTESAYRLVDGGTQIADLLAQSIKENGGTILTKSEVTKFLFDDNKMTGVEINKDETIEADLFISNIHPKLSLQLMQTSLIKNAYRTRIGSTEETVGIFTLYLAMKENSYPYINKNYYHFDTNNVWEGGNYTENTWPAGYMMHFSPTSKSETYTDSIIVNTYMNWDDVKQWVNTKVEHRGEDYKAFKTRKAEQFLDILERDFPNLRSHIKSYYTSTPLTYRDYTGTINGSVYGILKDFNNPLKTMILPKTKVPNLLHTGQNINIHGMVGVTICSMLTCGELLGMNYLINKMRNA